MLTLRDKITEAKYPVIFYELIPPPEKIHPTDLGVYMQYIIELLEKRKVDAVNIPEIRNDEEKGGCLQKRDTRQFARELKEALKDPLEVVINRCSVYDKRVEQEAWLRETLEVYGFNNLLIVGGRSSHIQYPGPSVIEMADKAKESFFLGGITMASRLGEPERLVEKGLHGMEFFTTQVIYETGAIQQLLKNYDTLCLQRGLKAKRIFLSFAPISTKKDVEILRWLGVPLSKEAENILFESNGAAVKSLQMAKFILEEILRFVQEERIQVPLGLNLEHISRHNFNVFQDFIDELVPCLVNFYRFRRIESPGIERS